MRYKAQSLSKFFRNIISFDSKQGGYTIRNGDFLECKWFINQIVQEEVRKLPEYGASLQDLRGILRWRYMSAYPDIYASDDAYHRTPAIAGLGATILWAIRGRKPIETFRENEKFLSVKRLCSESDKNPFIFWLCGMLSRSSISCDAIERFAENMKQVTYGFPLYPHGYYLMLRWHKRRNYVYLRFGSGGYTVNQEHLVIKIMGPLCPPEKDGSYMYAPNNLHFSIITQSETNNIKPGDYTFFSEVVYFGLALSDLIFGTDTFQSTVNR